MLKKEANAVANICVNAVYKGRKIISNGDKLPDSQPLYVKFFLIRDEKSLEVKQCLEDNEREGRNIENNSNRRNDREDSAEKSDEYSEFNISKKHDIESLITSSPFQYINATNSTHSLVHFQDLYNFGNFSEILYVKLYDQKIKGHDDWKNTPLGVGKSTIKKERLNEEQVVRQPLSKDKPLKVYMKFCRSHENLHIRINKKQELDIKFDYNPDTSALLDRSDLKNVCDEDDLKSLELKNANETLTLESWLCYDENNKKIYWKKQEWKHFKIKTVECNSENLEFNKFSSAKCLFEPFNSVSVTVDIFLKNSEESVRFEQSVPLAGKECIDIDNNESDAPEEQRDTRQEDKENATMFAMIGGGGAVAVALILIVTFFMLKRKRNSIKTKKNTTAEEDYNVEDDNPYYGS